VVLAGSVVVAGIALGKSTAAEELRLTRLSAEGLPSSDVTAPGAEDARIAWAGLQVTPDGRWIVYAHDDRIDQVYELYAVSRDGATRIRLSPDLEPGESLRWFALTPDGASVVSLRGFAATGDWALYRVPIGGPGAGEGEQLVYREPDPERWISRTPLGISPDSDWLVFGTAPRFDTRADWIFTAQLEESPAKPRRVFTTAGWDRPSVGAYFSPDSNHLVLLADRLFSLPLPGGPGDLVRLDEGEAVLGRPARASITPDSARVLFVESREEPADSGLFSVPIGGPGSAAVRLSPPIADSRGLSVYVKSADSEVVTFLLRPERLGPGQAWSAPVAGPVEAAVRLDAGAMGWEGAGMPYPTPDSLQAVLSLDPEGLGERRLVRVPILGPAEAAVPLTPLYGPRATFLGTRFSPDGRQTVYGVDVDLVPPNRRFYSVPLAGPPELARPLGDAFTDELQLAWATVDPTSRTVAVVADFDAPFRYEIVRARFDRPDLPAEPVHPELPPEASACSELVWTPDGLGLIFRAELDAAGKVELFIADGLIFEDDLESGDDSRWSEGAGRRAAR